MASKFKNLKAQSESNLKETVRNSAQEIWLAGLGAFSKAQAEGTKVFEALVKEGAGLQKKTRALAEDKLAGMTGNVAKAASQWTKTASGISGKAQSTATETWDKLEQVFEDRVARALTRLGVPSQREVQALAKRVEELTDAINGLARKPARAAAAAKKAPARKASRK